MAISRLPHCGATAIGQRLAEELGYGFFGREILSQIARERGIQAQLVEGLDDRVRGLDAGADDYLMKPYALEELLARLRAVTRRGRSRQYSAVLSYGPVELDQRDKVVKVNGEPIVLTATEFRLLEYLLLRAEKPVPRDELARHVWGGAAGLTSNVVDVYISYLRKKLKGAGVPLVRTVRNVGYILTGGCA